MLIYHLQRLQVVLKFYNPVYKLKNDLYAKTFSNSNIISLLVT